jgi:hypothetical protein
MGLFGWFGKKSDDRGVRAWREAWAAAVTALDTDAVARLEAALRQEPPLADDLEVEEEMLEALRQLLVLEGELAASRLPSVDTTHRVVGADRCHYSAPVSVPDDPAQPTGRLLLTSTRAVFAGGARTPALPWHAVRDVVQTGRDLIFVIGGAAARGDASGGHDVDGQRFRCNSFAEALSGAAIARHLLRRARSPRL